MVKIKWEKLNYLRFVFYKITCTPALLYTMATHYSNIDYQQIPRPNASITQKHFAVKTKKIVCNFPEDKLKCQQNNNKKKIQMSLKSKQKSKAK